MGITWIFISGMVCGDLAKSNLNQFISDYLNIIIFVQIDISKLFNDLFSDLIDVSDPRWQPPWRRLLALIYCNFCLNTQPEDIFVHVIFLQHKFRWGVLTNSCSRSKMTIISRLQQNTCICQLYLFSCLLYSLLVKTSRCYTRGLISVV